VHRGDGLAGQLLADVHGRRGRRQAVQERLARIDHDVQLRLARL
jgi:hypothetical protein